MTFLRAVKAGVVLVILLILQLELFASIRFFGVMPELMLGAAVASGWHGGPNDGAIMGFASGFLVDLYLASPMGLSALSYALTGYLLGIIVIDRPRIQMHPYNLHQQPKTQHSENSK